MTTDKQQAPKLLDMRVASFTHFLQGPAASQYLADMGADVIKVEAPGGNYERRWLAAGRDVGGYGSLLLAANRNLRSIVIDLKGDLGREAALKLIENSDVVIENYRPGVMDRLGLGYEAVKVRKPDIIYASATGYGPDGPLSKGPGQDLLAQARAGMVAQNGEFGTRPTPIGNSGIDQHAATLLALGIVGAFARKLTTGEGTRVDGTLYNACVDFMQEGLVHYFSGDHDSDVLKRTRTCRAGTWRRPMAPTGSRMVPSSSPSTRTRNCSGHWKIRASLRRSTSTRGGTGTAVPNCWPTCSPI